MQFPDFPFILFPHTTLSEAQLRRFSILLPHLSMLQTLRPAPIPEWAEGQFESIPAFAKEEMFKRVEAYRKGVQDMAAIQGTGGMLAALANEWEKPEGGESRFSIQSTLKGMESERADPEETLLIEAAVFLELAKDLDEQEMELEADGKRLERLEDEFRSILGAVDEEEMAELRDVASYAITSDKTSISFMLRKRMAQWLRLLAGMEPKESVVLTAVTREALDELLEAIRSRSGQESGEWKITETALAAIPDPARLEPEDFLKLRTSREDAGNPIPSLWKAIGEVVRDPQLAGGIAIQSAAEACSRFVSGFFKTPATVVEEEARLTMVHIENFPHDAFQRYIDKPGFEMWEGALSHLGPVTMLCVE